MLTVIGCGNPNRSDDGVGVAVAQRLIARLQRHPIAGVQAFDCGTAGMDVMYRARGTDALLIVDACQSGGPAGAIYDVPGEELEGEREPSYSLHDFRWDHALHAGRKIYQDDFPSDVRVWLIEAETIGLGLGLSPAVEAAADQVFQRVLDHVAAYVATRGSEQALVDVELCRGVVRLPAALFEARFVGVEALAVLPQDDGLHLFPVAAAAGGILVKQRNAAGDRSVDAADVLRREGWDDIQTYPCKAHWDAESGALVITQPGAVETRAPATRPTATNG